MNNKIKTFPLMTFEVGGVINNKIDSKIKKEISFKNIKINPRVMQAIETEIHGIAEG